jgi:caspase domain-containing protein
MTPWIERGPAADGSGDPCTHALVVGVSRYEFLTEDGSPGPGGRETFGLQQVKTPATSAFLFARWLETTYRSPTAPLGTIRLLLSPSEWEQENVPDLAEIPAEAVPATRANVEEAVAEWFAACSTNADNVAVLYASGHGIQMSPDDGGIVLLEDFARFPSVLDFSLDVGAVRKGMAGPTMAQRQFYFVDACRVRPEAALRFQTLGSGVGLPNPFAGTARVSAVYFAATPSTEALGAPGKGTLFVQALVECLDTALGVDDHVQPDRTWAVTATTLVSALPKRVRELAETFGAEQTATTGGQLEDVPFHTLEGKPQVPIAVELAPEGAAAVALARLFDPQAGDVFDGEAFAPRIAREVPAGNYLLEVRLQPPTPPFKDVSTFVVPALPPSYSETLTVAEDQ